MSQESIIDIASYLRLCGRLHKRKYVVISVMLS